LVASCQGKVFIEAYPATPSCLKSWIPPMQTSGYVFSKHVERPRIVSRYEKHVGNGDLER